MCIYIYIHKYTPSLEEARPHPRSWISSEAVEVRARQRPHLISWKI